MKQVLVLAFSGLLAVAVASAAKKPKPLPPPPPAPTEDQMRSAYAAGVGKMVADTSPATLRVDPVEKAWFRLGSSKKGEWVEMMLIFDGQNRLGAMVRGTAMCALWLHGSDAWEPAVICKSGTFDFVALGMVPKGMVQIGH
ncbi:MAG TPA: hypothetical protein VGZ73_02710 [Bryobacteraceae bacterium]|jgi:hypothetical protein|nr:hypothetical protein [Bryobacteraceae bacterium]